MCLSVVFRNKLTLLISLPYGALALIFFEPQLGHSVAPFFKKVFLHETHQNIELPFFNSSRSSGIIEKPVYVLHMIPTSC